MNIKQCKNIKQTQTNIYLHKKLHQVHNNNLNNLNNLLVVDFLVDNNSHNNNNQHN